MVRAKSEVRCPQCGELPRVVVLEVTQARFVLNGDGSVGRVLGLNRKKEPIPVGYECGGGHKFDTPDETPSHEGT
jgi:hypothetical protein